MKKSILSLIIIVKNLKIFLRKKDAFEDACVAQFIRPVGRQSKDLGSYPSAVESVFFFHRKIFECFKVWISSAFIAI